MTFITNLNITLALIYLLFIVLFQHLLNRNMVNSNYVSEKEIATSDILYIKCLPTESVSVPDAWIPDSTITLPSRHITPPPLSWLVLSLTSYFWQVSRSLTNPFPYFYINSNWQIKHQSTSLDSTISYKLLLTSKS